MPGEFEPHLQTWMMWPERRDVWREDAGPAQNAFVEVASAISEFEPVVMLVSAAQFQHARQSLPAGVRLVEMSYNDAWARDILPSFVTNRQGETRLVDWDFNAWGGLVDGLYVPWDQDQLVGRKIPELEGMDRYDAGHFVLEGGAFQVDGDGTLITTEECLLSPGRNPDLTKDEIEENLSLYLGIEKVIWLSKGIDSDGTNGHVDNLCAFVQPGELIVHWTEDRNHPHYEICQAVWNRLTDSIDARGRKFKLHKLPAPSAIYRTSEDVANIIEVESTATLRIGDLLPASYINFYLVNGGVIVPAFGVETDQFAHDSLTKVFPGRKVIQIRSGREILLGGGNVHCITQQQPVG